ncbi:Protein EXORDIUM [Ananas comosus]|uniref:Protein EXORDIUM n=1 Tax=Ananas comosus TaxID=4615 RepID=A0A199VLS3_ANACO|nr:Protein EXORDIUM [Ananas comosus]
MAMARDRPLFFFFLFLFLFLFYAASAATPRELFLVPPQTLTLDYHNGSLLTGNYTLHLLWYGRFPASHRSIVADFVRSLSSPSPSPFPSPSVASWWRTLALYGGAAPRVALGRQTLDESLSLGRTLSEADLARLAARLAPHRGAIAAILTSPDVLVDGFCVGRCGLHGAARAGRRGRARFAYLWAGDSSAQCPGQCAWPFHRPIYGPQAPPLVPPNGDVGVDGVVINLATLLAGAVTNPFGTASSRARRRRRWRRRRRARGVREGRLPGLPGAAAGGPHHGGELQRQRIRREEVSVARHVGPNNVAVRHPRLTWHPW